MALYASFGVRPPSKDKKQFNALEDYEMNHRFILSCESTVDLPYSELAR